MVSANIHAKRSVGITRFSEDYPAKDAFKKSAKTAREEEVEYTTEKKLDKEKKTRM